MSYVVSLVSRDSDNTTFEVLGEGPDYEGRPKVFIRQCGHVGWHRITQADLCSDFTAFPNPADVADLSDAGAALRLIPLPDTSDLMARANAVRWNKDLIEAARARETNPPAAAPGACRWCDRDAHGHCTSYSLLVGGHQYTAPTDRMILARLKARRAARAEVTARG